MKETFVAAESLTEKQRVDRILNTIRKRNEWKLGVLFVTTPLRETRSKFHYQPQHRSTVSSKATIEQPQKTLSTLCLTTLHQPKKSAIRTLQQERSASKIVRNLGSAWHDTSFSNGQSANWRKWLAQRQSDCPVNDEVYIPTLTIALLLYPCVRELVFKSMLTFRHPWPL